MSAWRNVKTLIETKVRDRLPFGWKLGCDGSSTLLPFTLSRNNRVGSNPTALTQFS